MTTNNVLLKTCDKVLTKENHRGFSFLQLHCMFSFSSMINGLIMNKATGTSRIQSPAPSNLQGH